MPAGTLPSRDLVGHDQVLLDPVDGGRLVAPPALVVRQRLALVTLQAGRVVVQRGPRPFALRGHPLHQALVHAPEALERRALRGDVGLLPGRALGLGRCDQPLGMERVEAVAQRIGRRERASQQPGQPGVGLPGLDVVEALPAGREQPDQRLDLGRLAVAARPRPELHVLADGLVQPQGPQRLQHQRQAGPRRQRVGARHPLHLVRQESLAHRLGRLPAGPPGCWPRSSARFTAVTSSTIPHSAW